jgi:WD40 repeat protein
LIKFEQSSNMAGAGFLLVFFSLLHALSASGQTGPGNLPEPGDYFSLVVTGNTNYTNTYHTTKKIWEWKWQPGVQFMPSAFGRLRFKADKTYEFIDLKKSGTYFFDERSGKIGFTGFMQGAEALYAVQNGNCMLLISITDKSGARNTIQFEKKSGQAQENQPSKKNNHALPGLLVASIYQGNTSFIDIRSGRVVKEIISRSTGIANNSKTAVHIFKNNPFDMSEIYPTVVVTNLADGRQISFAGESRSGTRWVTGDYWYAAPSPDGKRIVLTGKYVARSNPFHSNYTAPYPVVSVIDKEGKEIKQFDTDKQAPWGASWLPDGGLLFAGKNGGISITDSSLSLVKDIYFESVNEARCSPNGKKIAVAQGAEIFTLNRDGTGKQSLVTGEPGADIARGGLTDMCWSPDGKYLAVAIKHHVFNHYFVAFLSVDGSHFSYLKDAGGALLQLSQPFISWITN